MERFNELISKIPEEARFIKEEEPMFDNFIKNSCVFGLPAAANFRTLEQIPVHTKGLYFYFGADIEGLLEEAIRLKVNERLEHLTIGFHHNNRVNCSDYSKI